MGASDIRSSSDPVVTIFTPSQSSNPARQPASEQTQQDQDPHDQQGEEDEGQENDEDEDPEKRHPSAAVLLNERERMRAGELDAPALGASELAEIDTILAS